MRRLQRQVGIYVDPYPNHLDPNPNHVDPNPNPNQVDIYVEVDNNGEQPRLRRPVDLIHFMRLCRQLKPSVAARPRWRLVRVRVRVP